MAWPKWLAATLTTELPLYPYSAGANGLVTELRAVSPSAPYPQLVLPNHCLRPPFLPLFSMVTWERGEVVLWYAS